MGITDLLNTYRSLHTFDLTEVSGMMSGSNPTNTLLTSSVPIWVDPTSEQQKENLLEIRYQWIAKNVANSTAGTSRPRPTDQLIVFLVSNMASFKLNTVLMYMDRDLIALSIHTSFELMDLLNDSVARPPPTTAKQRLESLAQSWKPKMMEGQSNIPYTQYQSPRGSSDEVKQVESHLDNTKKIVFKSEPGKHATLRKG
jgi:hypothetical protein